MPFVWRDEAGIARARLTIANGRMTDASIPTTRAACEALDCADPLASVRERFSLPEGVIYLDGHSLGPATHAALEAVFAARGSEIAAVITEGVPANMGVVPPVDGFEACKIRRDTAHDEFGCLGRVLRITPPAQTAFDIGVTFFQRLSDRLSKHPGARQS